MKCSSSENSTIEAEPLVELTPGESEQG
jgi:hypothetical protein